MEDDPGHHRRVSIMIRRQRDADPHHAEVGGRDHQVDGQGGRQPGPSPPQPERRRHGDREPRDARREQGRPEVLALRAGDNRQ